MVAPAFWHAIFDDGTHHYFITKPAVRIEASSVLQKLGRRHTPFWHKVMQVQ
jgi:hypothetical protein